MKQELIRPLLIWCLFSLVLLSPISADYRVVDTGQTVCYDATGEISPPAPGEPFHGQDAQYAGNQPSYSVSGDGLTVLDGVTGLTWRRMADTDLDGVLETEDKLTWSEVQGHVDELNALGFGGYDDWHLPSIQELYSLIQFTGIDPSGYTGGTEGLVPFIDETAFEFIYGNEAQGERVIDAQYWSSNQYVSTIFDGQIGLFGVNFADGRIKCYPRDMGPGGAMNQFTLCVRGGTDYGVNDLVDNGDGTVTDRATGLMWEQADSGTGLSWEAALAHAEGNELAGHDDWRLPDAKELQSILDYSRSPATHGTAAIDPIFSCTAITDEDGGSDFPFYWSSTTHANWTAQEGVWGAYVAFGSGLGWMEFPPNWELALYDVHGAGCQRSDPKDGDPGEYPDGHGPQGDVVRIFNFVRCVRDAGSQPTPTPTPDLTPSPTPMSHWYDLILDDDYLVPGDRFHLWRRAHNGGGSPLPVDEYIVLDIRGDYWFWPSWGQDVDWSVTVLPAGQTEELEILELLWPDGAGALPEVTFWGAVTQAGTVNLIDYDSVDWGFGEI